MVAATTSSSRHLSSRQLIEMRVNRRGAPLGEVLAGSDRPLVITSGTGLARSKTGGPAVETDDHVTSAEFPRFRSIAAEGCHWVDARGSSCWQVAGYEGYAG